MPNVVNYNLVRGFAWDRQLCVKSRRTHWRIQKLSTVIAFVKISASRKKQITAEFLGNNNLKLSLTADDTHDLPVGVLAYDVWAIVDGNNQPVVKDELILILSFILVL